MIELAWIFDWSHWLNPVFKAVLYLVWCCNRCFEFLLDGVSILRSAATLNGQFPLLPLALHKAHRNPRNRLTLICLSHLLGTSLSSGPLTTGPTQTNDLFIPHKAPSFSVSLWLYFTSPSLQWPLLTFSSSSFVTWFSFKS